MTQRTWIIVAAIFAFLWWHNYRVTKATVPAGPGIPATGLGQGIGGSQGHSTDCGCNE